MVSGIRAEDMALRLKYAGVKPENYKINKDPVAATRDLAALLKDGEMGYLFPTYTAMVEVRSNFASKDDSLCDMGKVTKRGI